MVKSGLVLLNGGAKCLLANITCLDSKNRMIVPAKLRDGLGERFVITKGLDGCLIRLPGKRMENT